MTDSKALSSSTSKSHSEELGNYLIVKWNESEPISIPTGPISSNIDTEIDDIIQCLIEESKINDEEFKEFIKFIKDRKYDTDSIFMNVTMNNIISSNIFTLFPTFQSVINTHIHHRKCMLII